MRDMGEIDVLTGVPIREALRSPQDPTSPAHRRQLLKDNAVRLLITLDLGHDALDRSEFPRALELGAGSAYVVTALRWRYGPTIDLYAVEHPNIANQALRSAFAERAINFEPHDLTARGIPWPDRDFDLIVLGEVIEHLPPTSVPDLLKELGSRLMKTGALIISSPNPQAFSNVLLSRVRSGGDV